MSAFITRSIALTAILGGIVWALTRFSEVHLPEVIYLVILAFFGLTVMLFRSLIRANEKSPSRFVSSFMGAVAIKLLATMAFLGVYLYLNKDHRIEMAMAVFVVYIAFMIILSSSVISTLREK
ncbi:MAG: hypothetical protein KDC12_01175 [Flavobacteriales bacterium]|nr:hypothetical protein [Flavobacteriales bacterium]